MYFILQEAGEEKCVIETRTRGKSGESEGSCTQTCTIGPVTDTCNSQQAVESPEGLILVVVTCSPPHKHCYRSF